MQVFCDIPRYSKKIQENRRRRQASAKMDADIHVDITPKKYIKTTTGTVQISLKTSVNKKISRHRKV